MVGPETVQVSKKEQKRAKLIASGYSFAEKIIAEYGVETDVHGMVQTDCSPVQTVTQKTVIFPDGTSVETMKDRTLQLTATPSLVGEGIGSIRMELAQPDSEPVELFTYRRQPPTSFRGTEYYLEQDGDQDIIKRGEIRKTKRVLKKYKKALGLQTQTQVPQQ